MKNAMVANERKFHFINHIRILGRISGCFGHFRAVFGCLRTLLCRRSIPMPDTTYHLVLEQSGPGLQMLKRSLKPNFTKLFTTLINACLHQTYLVLSLYFGFNACMVLISSLLNCLEQHGCKTTSKFTHLPLNILFVIFYIGIFLYIKFFYMDDLSLFIRKFFIVDESLHKDQLN